MKIVNRFTFILLLLVFIPALATAQPSRNTATTLNNSSTQEHATLTHKPQQNNSNSTGYTIDGLATASQLAAQRSHAISKDQKLFTFFSGLSVVTLVLYLAHFFFGKEMRRFVHLMSLAIT